MTPRNGYGRSPSGDEAMSRFLKASHRHRGTLWAAIDDQAHHLTGQVAERRFSAFLRPFKSVGEAQAALIAEGGISEPTETQRRCRQSGKASTLG